ncbi:MAG: anthranilate synthase component I [Beijerinckiaceae bacterium]
MSWKLQGSDGETAMTTRGGLSVMRNVRRLSEPFSRETLAARLDTCCGALFSSQTEFPGRYARHDLGFSDPPLMLEARGLDFRLSALNHRGEILLAFVAAGLRDPAVAIKENTPRLLAGRILPGESAADESLRTRRPSIFTLVRALRDLFAMPDDPVLGLMGAFGYDLIFQIEDLAQKLPREDGARDLVLYLPDRILVTDHAAQASAEISYEFAWTTAAGERLSTAGSPRETDVASAYDPAGGSRHHDHPDGTYLDTVATAKEHFARGDLFEAVPGQLFAEPCKAQPSAVFAALSRINPAPFGALINLGQGEFLVSASPEMYVRSDGRRIETCPISGTIARGADSLGDAEQIRKLLNSQKDEFELNMCTDVDRNDKARICVPGSVRVIGRRQIEVYSKLIHTVDHVEGELREGFDALDAFLSHAWAVTVTGAPKLWAMQFIEDHEKSARRWYGGAIGAVGFDGSMNTGLTIRTIRMEKGVGEVRVGATLLYDSDPDAEDAECRIKGAASFQALREAETTRPATSAEGSRTAPAKSAGRAILVDCEDSFVHMLADYLRQAGAEVLVVRHTHAADLLKAERFDRIVLSPGPGRPEDFMIRPVIDHAIATGTPLFGVCLGMQALGEYFGGRLGQLQVPAHGRPAKIKVRPQSQLFGGLPEEVTIGRYHSLFVDPQTMPGDLVVTAATEDGVPMAIEHRDLPIAAVQFHPESIMSLEGGAGLTILRNALAIGRKD